MIIHIILHRVAEQICYAVLCVFSYLAAGQEQKKQILQQAARGPNHLEKSQGEEVATSTSPTAVAATKQSPSTTATNMRQTQSKQTAQLARKQSDTDVSATSSTAQQIPSGRILDPSEVVTSNPPPRHPPPPLVPPRHGYQGTSVSREGSLRGRPPPAVTQEGPTRQMSQGAPPAIPPRKAPPPLSIGRHNTMPDPQDFRLSSNNSKSQSPPTQISPISQQSSGSSPVLSQSPPRRLGQRQGSISGPYSGPNPFVTPQRTTEFVIPQRHNSTRGSLSRQSSQSSQDMTGTSPPRRR